MKVATKVVVVSSLILTIAIGLLSLVKYQKLTNAQHHQLNTVIGESSHTLSLKISNWLQAKLNVIELTAQVIDRDFDAEKINSTFNVPRLGSDFLRIFGGLQHDGNVISNDPHIASLDVDVRTRPWYELARQSQGVKITAPYIDTVSHETVISVTTQLTDNGVFKGAFGGDLSLASLSDSINAHTFNGAGYAFLLSADGQIITHPDDRYHGQSYQTLFAGKTLTFSNQQQTVEVDGKTLWVSFIPLNNRAALDWSIAVVIDADVAMHGADALILDTLLIELLAAIASALLLGALLKHILKPISSLSQSLLDINSGNGDLTKRLPITSNDEFAEVAREFNTFVDNLQGMIGNVKGMANEVERSNEMVSVQSEQASTELRQQLTELDQLATAMTQMASSSAEVASNAQVAAQEAMIADQETLVGVEVVQTATDAITHLSVLMESAVDSVNELSNFSNNIESILTVITAIADQTNLLALNAAIEAARAGESGRGFAVVADEVRSLASRTQDSTREIRNMIEQLQAGVSEAEQSIRDSREVALATASGSDRVNNALDSIRQAIIKINDMSMQIAAASEEQSATSEEINRNTNNIRDISQHVADGAQAQVQHTQRMKQQVDQQSEQLSQFKV